MPFLRLLYSDNKNQLKVNSTVNSLRTYLEFLFQIKPLKRVSSFTSKRLKASMTVEAAIALPLFLFFIMQVLSAINMIAVQSRLEAALHQTGNRMAFAGYLYENPQENTLTDLLESAALTQVYAQSQVLNYTGKEYLNKSCVKNGSEGISFKGTSIMNDDIIDIKISYYIQPLFTILGFDGFYTGQRYYGRAWTGYDVESAISNMDDNDPMVYITETGTVYHTNRNCTYLNPSVYSVSTDEVAEKRNQSGKKYSACGKCASKFAYGNVVYITNQGSSYHTSITCSGLKRTVYTIALSQVGERGRCSKCR